MIQFQEKAKTKRRMEEWLEEWMEGWMEGQKNPISYDPSGYHQQFKKRY